MNIFKLSINDVRSGRHLLHIHYLNSKTLKQGNEFD